MPLFLGLDCGGTSTRAIVIDDNESLVFEGSGGPGNLSTSTEATVRNSLKQATEAMPPVDSVVGCFAGLLGAERREMALKLIREICPNAKSGAEADYMAALAAAPESTDVVVIAGTGSVVCSWKEGKAYKTGGRGPLLGDFGSAFDVAKSALTIRLTLDTNGPKQPDSAEFWSGFKSIFGTDDPETAAAAVYSDPSPASSLAKLAPLVASEYCKKRSYAVTAINGSMRRLAGQVKRHVEQASLELPDLGRSNWRDETLRVGLAGGLWSASPLYEQVFLTMLEEPSEEFDPTDFGLRQYHVERLDAPPVLGAARLAKLLFYEH